MIITFGESKECCCYEELVNNPTDRNIIKKFTKKYPHDIIEPAIKLHERLKSFDTAADYQVIYGKTKNGIELKEGVKDKDPLILKLRVSLDYRKFFYHVLCPETPNYLLKKDWNGQFSEIKHIYVYDVNKHKYD